MIARYHMYLDLVLLITATILHVLSFQTTKVIGCYMVSGTLDAGNDLKSLSIGL